MMNSVRTVEAPRVLDLKRMRLRIKRERSLNKLRFKMTTTLLAHPSQLTNRRSLMKLNKKK